MPISEKHLNFLNALGNFFFEKIDADERFKIKRITEWCENMPTPPPSSVGSTDSAALSQIGDLSRYLSSLDAKHSAYGNKWPPDVVREFVQKCNEIKEIIKTHDVDKSIQNLYHHHRATCYRSTGDFDLAIKEIKKATDILQDYIQNNAGDWPRYSRNIILNKGHESDFNRRNGDIKSALESSNTMMLMADDFHKNDEFSQFETKLNLPPIRSWALYYACEAHLSVKEWDDLDAKESREYIFNLTFGQKHFLNWSIPTLIQIIRNDLWKERYPHYFEEIANRVFVGTAEQRFIKLLREVSILAGRVRIKPAPSLIAAMAIILAISTTVNVDLKQTRIETSDIVLVIDSGIEHVRETNNEIRFMQEADISQIRANIIKDAERIVKGGDNMIEEAINLHAAEAGITEADLTPLQWRRFASGVNSNEQGVGPGIMQT